MCPFKSFTNILRFIIFIKAYILTEFCNDNSLGGQTHQPDGKQAVQGMR